MRRVALNLAFVALLLVAQQIALTHAAWHVSHDAQNQSQNKDGSHSQKDLCQLHGLFAQVVGSGPGAHFDFVVSDVLPHHFTASDERFETRHALVTRCRGPPVLSPEL